MNAKSLLIASAIAVGLAMPATAQQSTTMHRYASFFKYTDQAIKELLNNPQDRTAAVSKLFDAFARRQRLFMSSRWEVNSTESSSYKHQAILL